MPGISLSDQRKLVLASLPLEYMVAVLRALLEAYRRTNEHCARYRQAERLSLFGHMRHTEFEGLLQDVSRTFAGFDVAVEPNSNGSANHTEVRHGLVLLTQSGVDHSGEFPRRAIFRRTLARSPQADWLAPPERPSPKEGTFYTVLAYGPRGASRPYFASLVIPDENFTTAMNRIEFMPLLSALALQTDIKAAVEQIYGNAPDIDMNFDIPATPDAHEESVRDDLQLTLTEEAKEEIRKRREAQEEQRRRSGGGEEEEEE